MPGQNPRDLEDLERLKWARAELDPSARGHEVEALDNAIAAMEEPSEDETAAIVEAKGKYQMTPRMMKRARRMRDDGMTWESIGAVLGYSHTTIMRNVA